MFDWNALKLVKLDLRDYFECLNVKPTNHQITAARNSKFDIFYLAIVAIITCFNSCATNELFSAETIFEV